MTKPDIHRLLEFQRLLAQFSQIDRVVHRRHNNEYRHENDTEHSYNLAMTAWFLSPHFPELDPSKLIQFALIHDLVEVHAGDTYAFAPAEELVTKHEREAEALTKLSEGWQDFPEMIDLLHDYEKRDTAEAKFVYALDKIMPIMQIYIHEGHTWKQENMTLERLHSVKKFKVSDSPGIEDYYQQLYKLLSTKPELLPPR